VRQNVPERESVVQCTLAVTVQNEERVKMKEQPGVGTYLVLYVTMMKKGGGVGSKRALDSLAPLDAFAAAAAFGGSAAATPTEVSSAETSPSPFPVQEVQQFLVPSPPKPSASAALPNYSDPLDVQLFCTTYNCVGGSWSGHEFEPCDKRPAFQQHRHHARDVVCIIHHRFIKCATCSLHIYEGCWVKSSNGYTQPKRDVPWKFAVCTLQPSVASTVKPENTNPEENSKCTLPLAGGASEGLPLATELDEGAKCKCIFSSRQVMLAHMREQGWVIKITEDNRIYFTCKQCSLRIKAKAQSGDVENGDWLAVNVPSSHDCVKFKPVATAMTTRVCNLPNTVFSEIQRLACSKAFNTVSIQTFIKLHYSILVDTSLIYNIGYRARQKLGIAEMEKLVLQREVCVNLTYTSPSSCKLTTITGTTSSRPHL
jgi:hypothetical protein